MFLAIYRALRRISRVERRGVFQRRLRPQRYVTVLTIFNIAVYCVRHFLDFPSRAGARDELIDFAIAPRYELLYAYISAHATRGRPPRRQCDIRHGQARMLTAPIDLREVSSHYVKFYAYGIALQCQCVPTMILAARALIFLYGHECERRMPLTFLQ